MKSGNSRSINILLLGSGGRESAFAWKLSQSKRLLKLYIAPGNAGTSQYGVNVEIDPTNFGAIKQFVLKNNINMVVVGPEEPLVRGLYDFFMDDSEIQNIPVIGPSALGAKLEGSKDFAKKFMIKHNVPTAAYQSFTKATLENGYLFLESLKAPYVLKADGLAAGKGVLIINSLDEAKAALGEVLNGKFGNAGNMVVIEEFLSGIECSVFVATDGENFKILPEAKDYKRIGDGDTGPNTGGMGAISPVPFADKIFMDKVLERIVKPTVEGLKIDKIDYKGFIFIGLMSVNSEPYVIEYNVRMGDPETEVVMPRIESDIIEMFEKIAVKQLDQYQLVVSPLTAAAVVCVSGGYPDSYENGLAITGLDEQSDSIVFHAGTVAKAGKVLTSGGRVLVVTSLAKTIKSAVNKSYSRIKTIDYQGKYHRSDIGKDLIELKK